MRNGLFAKCCGVGIPLPAHFLKDCEEVGGRSKLAARALELRVGSAPLGHRLPGGRMRSPTAQPRSYA